MAMTAPRRQDPASGTPPGTVHDHSRAGEPVRIRGERGRYRWRARVRTPEGSEWVELYGGPPGHEGYRFVRPDRVLPEARP